MSHNIIETDKSATVESKKLIKQLAEASQELRRSIFLTICQAGGGHTPASLSIVEILTVLFHAVLRINPMNRQDPERDRFILSKGHAAVALYAVLAQKGMLDKGDLNTFGQKGTILGGHPDMHKVPWVEATTGALGHGFPFGMGIALAGKMNKQKYRVFVLLGDGECQEGSIWEAALFAAQKGLDNLIAIIDYNKLQAMDRLEEIVGLEPLADKWRAFGWVVHEVDGHDIGELLNVLCHGLPLVQGKPNMIIAHTIKGKGISFMENVSVWHYRMPNSEELKIAYRELGIKDIKGEGQ